MLFCAGNVCHVLPLQGWNKSNQGPQKEEVWDTWTWKTQDLGRGFRKHRKFYKMKDNKKSLPGRLGSYWLCHPHRQKMPFLQPLKDIDHVQMNMLAHSQTADKLVLIFADKHKICEEIHQASVLLKGPGRQKNRLGTFSRVPRQNNNHINFNTN